MKASMLFPDFNKILLYQLFALSGFCALVYEILWARYLALTFGTGIIAVSLVTATFMCGLALGSYFIGRRCDRCVNLLRLYAFLEIGIGVSALFFPLLLSLVRALYVYGAQQLPENPALIWPLYLFCASIILIIPAFCMGGTLPVMCRLFRSDKAGGHVGLLYGLNTLGATLGTLACGFLLIPSLGLSKTGWLAVSGNLLIALCALYLSRKADGSERVTLEAITEPEAQEKDGIYLYSIGLIGFFSLGYEILWTRVFLLFLGNTTYAFSIMLGAYLVGIALGGLLYALLIKQSMDLRRLFTWLASGLALSILVTVPWYDRLVYIFQTAYEWADGNWTLYTLCSFLIVFLIMALPTVFSGAALPAVVNIISSGQSRLGSGVGRVVFWNTLGAVVGSLVAAFVLIPTIGLFRGFQLLAAVNLLMAFVLWVKLKREGRKMWPAPALLALGFILILFSQGWDAKLMTAGVYYYAPKYAVEGGIDLKNKELALLDLWEGTDTTVSVHETIDGVHRFFRVNGKADGSTFVTDMPAQILVSHLPMLMHPNPEEVMVIGLGSGVSLRGLPSYPTKTVDCIEISPGVVDAEHYFRQINDNVLENPKVALTVADGRNYLLVREKQYDVVISHPSNPWQTGNSNLFTDDFYRLVTRRLKDGGLFCQWLNLYDITPENLRSACKTFLGNFPHAIVFKTGNDLIMVGADQVISLDYQLMKKRLGVAGISDALRAVGVDSVGTLIGQFYLFDEEPLKNFAASGELITDDNPVLEYSAQHNFGLDAYWNLDKRNVKALLDAKGGIRLPITNLGRDPWAVRFALTELIDGFEKAGRKTEAEFLIRYRDRQRGPS